METDSDDRDTLCEAHKDYMQRYVAFELEKQEKASDKFLKEQTVKRKSLPTHFDSSEV